MSGQCYLRSKGGIAYTPEVRKPLRLVPASVIEIAPDQVSKDVSADITQCDERGRFAAKCIADDMFELELIVPTADACSR